VTYPGETAPVERLVVPKRLGGRGDVRQYVEPTGSGRWCCSVRTDLSRWRTSASKTPGISVAMGTHSRRQRPNEPFIELFPASGAQRDIYSVPSTARSKR